MCVVKVKKKKKYFIECRWKMKSNVNRKRERMSIVSSFFLKSISSRDKEACTNENRKISEWKIQN